MSEMERFAQEAVEFALSHGATAAECTLAEAEHLCVNVRMQAVERVEEATCRGAGIRVLKGKRAASATTNDMSPEGLLQMVDSALNLVEVASEDRFAGLPEPAELCRHPGDLHLYSEDVAGLSPEYRIAQARAAEEAAFQLDSRVVSSEGAAFETFIGHHVFANSLGFCSSYRTTNCLLSVCAVAKQNGCMQRDHWSSSSRAAADLGRPEEIGRVAASRAVRRLNPRRIPTQKVPVLFEPRTASAFVGHLFNAANGSAVCRGRSFLGGKLGQRVASELLTLVDDGMRPGLLGSLPFDHEGVSTRRTVVIEKGILNSYLLNCYSAGKLGLNTTGNARRGPAGNIGIGHGNLYIAGPRSLGDGAAVESLAPRRFATPVFPPRLPSGLHKSLLVTGLVGYGVNTASGDYSQAVVGFWVEDGEIAFPVSDIIISGKLQQMLMDLEWVGSDLEFRTSLASPTLLIGQMTVSGG